MSDIPKYPPLKAPEPEPSTVEKSVSRDGAFSKPGHVSKGNSKTGSKGWSPAKGTRFRATNEKARGRPRKHPSDPRAVKYY